ncbi:MAG TPA: glycine--tRNA ligase subunit beta [Vicinamibacterales bacterium]|nr:glycine--tRNA ligase subunit beta [Vicinamibacterales bacterium]
MDRELLLEIGVEELPAAWLPGLTKQLAEKLLARLKELRLTPDVPVESFSTPRRLMARVGRMPERQEDLDETISGPPVSAAFNAAGEPTPAALGFAKKQGVAFESIERLETPKGTYLVLRKHHRGKSTVDALPELLGLVLRDLAFPKQMHWDAMIEDGKGEFVFGRPIRWLLYLYGGRVVPFAIGRTANAAGPQVQEVTTGAVTYGHRFLATSGRAGRSIKVRTFDEYRARLPEHFVILEHSERRDRIARELEAKARKLGGRVHLREQAALLDEVADLVEFPGVVAGFFDRAFLALPQEVLTTTLVHHQHYFPVLTESGELKEAFLAVVNTQPTDERLIAKNAERVVTARLRDAKFFWDADRKIKLEDRLERLHTVVFHKKMKDSSYRDKTERVTRRASWIAKEALGLSADEAHVTRAARLAKTDLVSDMVFEFPELQGVMGGIYAREEGLPEQVWKAIYFQYLPQGVEADAPPSRAALGTAAATWAALSMAEKADTLVSLFEAGEKPTGSRDPFGLRRNAQGLLRVLVDLPELTGIDRAVTLSQVIGPLTHGGGPDAALQTFLLERLRHLLEQRGFDSRNVRAVTHGDVDAISPLIARRKLEVLPEFTSSAEFAQLATAFKRVRNIARELPADQKADWSVLHEPAEAALLKELEQRQQIVETAVRAGDFRRGFAEAARFGPAVDKFFTDVFVMVDDPALKTARLSLMKRLEQVILSLADISEIVPQSE